MRSVHIAVVVLVLLCLLVVARVARADSPPVITWWVFSDGGASAVAGNITLNGSLGQMAVGRSATGTYALGAGYWLEQQEHLVYVYLPLVVKEFK